MSTSQQQLLPHIHHERQEPGSMLCAQHALNTLLQGNYYDATQLADIASELDDLESTQLGLSSAGIAARDRSSLNMDDTGFFSLSVLERALQVWGISLQNWRSETMRPRQANPENEQAFVLNLESHWFTVRSFGSSGFFWYNLNSFLPQPSWIGRNYLATLLHTAEQEGYSVFVAFASQGTLNDCLKEADADQVADLLPVQQAGSAGGAAVTAAGASTSLGLKPQASTGQGQGSWPSFSGQGSSSAGRSAADEDADLQAALRASLADSAAPAAESPSSSGGAVAAASSRLRRGRSGSGSNSMEGIEAPETDADVDAIAPNRQRMRSSGLGATATRTSGFEDEEDLRRAMEASLGPSPASASASGSTSTPGSAAAATTAAASNTGASSAMSLDTPSPRNLNRRCRRIQRRTTFGTTADDAIDLDASISDHDSPLHSTLSRSSFLSPAMVAANASNEDLPSDDDAIDPFSVPGAPEASALLGRGERYYDDEDRELQAALAASLGDEEAASRYAINQTHRGSEQGRSVEEELKTPDDVDRIWRMREEKKRKEREESEWAKRRGRGDISPSPVAATGIETAGEKGETHKTSERAEGDDEHDDEEDEDEDEDEEEEAVEVSAEEMRARRLARFG